MVRRQGPRPGGRSARVQASVHTATRDLLGQFDRAEITVPMIASKAGVTPSTIYRRWGDLGDLLADVAVEHLRPDTEPADTGEAQRDLLAWAEQYADEMSSAPGQEMLRDVLAASGSTGAQQCCTFTRDQITLIARRAASRGEAFPDPEAVIDGVVSPILFRILFAESLDPERIQELVSRIMKDHR
ncbi:TetR/AcrR family transcriptional regulator [Roseomonas elaeocarpi]|uniref:TetR/AcrR family transcriptional regulator n=1 Tax=Roseomonas elaeocarpi TaxID=907779 RepID=A0ABV6JNF4_9PROT